MNAQPPSVEALFSAALEIPTPNERAAYLKRACGSDEKLRQRVEALLQANVEAGSFLNHPPAEIDATTAGEGGHSSLHDSEAAVLALLAPCDKPDRIGKLQQYEIIDVVGHGGMGTVLRAFDTKLSRVVAVKVMAPELAANPTAVRRFLREATTAAAVVHDHVVTIHAVDDQHRPPYLVMEFIDGQTLQQKIDRVGALELKTILRIGSQAAAGLAAAHKTGLIHRDVKPANILLENGVERVKITDFGLARAADDLEMTKAGMIAGTPQYMSPEQAKGEPIDTRSDLFSLGCVLYTMATGRPAFRAETTMGVLKRVCEDHPRPIHEANPEIPAWFDAIVGNLLAKEPAQRLQTATEVADLLQQCLAHVNDPVGNALRGVPPVGWDQLAQPAPAHQSHFSAPTSTAPKSEIRNPKSAIRWSLAASLLLFATISLAESTGLTSLTSTVIRIVRGDGTLVVEVDDPNIQVLLDGDEIAITGAGPKELRLRPGKHELQTVKPDQPSDTKLITITRDGREIVKVAREQQTKTTSRAATGILLRQIWADAPDCTGSVSLDGRWIAFTDWETGDLAVRDVLVGEVRRITSNQQSGETRAFCSQPSFSPDCKSIAYWWTSSDKKQELRVVEIGGQTARTLYGPTEGLIYPCGWTSDGSKIMIRHRGANPNAPTSELRLIDANTGSSRLVKTLQGIPSPGPMLLSPDGRMVAYGGSIARGASRDIYLINVESGEETQLTTHPANDDELAWTPDSQHLVFERERDGAHDIWTVAIKDGKTIGPEKLVRSDVGFIESQGMTRDGSLFFGSSVDSPNIYTASLDLSTVTAVASPLAVGDRSLFEEFEFPAWSLDGQYLAYKSSSQNIEHLRIRDMQSGKIRALQPHFRAIGEFRWSPDGKSLLTASQKEPGKSGLYLIETDNGAVQTIVEDDDVAFGAGARWRPDGQGVFFQRNSKGIVFRDLHSQAERTLLTPRGVPFDVSRDGHYLAVSAWQRGSGPSDLKRIVKRIDLSSNEARDLLTIPSGNEAAMDGLSWSVNGEYLLYRRIYGSNDQRTIWFVSAEGGEPRSIAITGMKKGETVRHFALHPDGKQLAITTRGQRRYDIWALENFLPPLDNPKTTAAAAEQPQAPVAQAASTAAPPRGTSVRRVLNDVRLMNAFQGISPDGRYISHSNPVTGNLAIYDIAAANSRSVTTDSNRWEQYTVEHVFSHDGQRVAYNWCREDAQIELRIVATDGSGRKTIYHNPKVGYLAPYDWSPDGRDVLATLGHNDDTSQLALISVDDQSVKVLKSFEVGYSRGSACFSPDGRYIACNFQPAKNVKEHDIYLLTRNGNQETPIVQHSAHDSVLGWSPDGKQLLFSSNRRGATDAWLVRIENGKAQGAPQLVKPDLGQIVPMQLAHDGTFYYQTKAEENHIYTVGINLENDQILSEPKGLTTESVGLSFTPDWSPDGRFLAYVTQRDTASQKKSLCIRSLDTGHERYIDPNPDFQFRGTLTLRWFPDGKSIAVQGGGIVYRIDVESGQATVLIPKIGALGLEISPDAKSLYYTDFEEDGPKRRLFKRDIASGANQELYRYTGHYYLALSPDGRQLALWEADREGEKDLPAALKVIPTSGGPPQPIYRFQAGDVGGSGPICWTADGKQLLFIRKTKTDGGLWKVPVTGEPATRLALLPSVREELQQSQRRVEPPFTAAVHLRIHPDGQRIVFTAGRTKQDLWALENFLPPPANNP